MKMLTERALLLDDVLIIADLHVGFETELYRSGIKIPSQVDKLKNRILKLLKQTKAKQLIILGDLKHIIPVSSFQESREVPDLLEELSKKTKITIIKGNHDGDIEKMTNVNVVSSKGTKIGKYGLAHGHAWFSAKLLDCEYLIISHLHPAIEFNSRMKEHCWIRCEPDVKAIEKKFKKKCKIKEVIIMPVFNPIIGGISFNKEGFKPIGPIMNIINWRKGKIYLLDGTYLGRLDKITQQP